MIPSPVVVGPSSHVKQDEAQAAWRYYHGAIYGLWPTDPDANRRNARLELIRYLLRLGDNTRAQSELIALTAELPPDPAAHTQTGWLFLQAGDQRRALDEFGRARTLAPAKPSALLGTGLASFELGDYPNAERYLERAQRLGAADSHARELLATSKLVLQMDPFRRNLGRRERGVRITRALQQASQRLQQCESALGATPAQNDKLQSLQEQVAQLQRSLRNRKVAGNLELADTVISLAGQIETVTSQQCGKPAGADLALLLLARQGEER